MAFQDVCAREAQMRLGPGSGGGSGAFVQSPWGMTRTAERSRGRPAGCPGVLLSLPFAGLFGGCGPSPGEPEAELQLLSSPEDDEQTALLFSQHAGTDVTVL